MNTSKKFDFNNFKPHPFPKPGSSEWLKKVNSSINYTVNKDEQGLHISNYREQTTVMLELADYSIIGEDQGEWGGGITIISKKDRSETRWMRRYPVKEVLLSNKKIYVVEAMAHLHVSEGKIFELNLSDLSQDPLYGEKNLTELFDLGEATDAVAIEGDAWYMVSTKNLFVVHNRQGVLTKEYIVQDLPFGGLYPNSLVKEGENFYVGMRGGFAKIDLVAPQHISYYMLSKV